jgi:SAM-dependent methyltransferase
MIDITKALAIPGMMLGGELLWLAEQASTRKRIVEVGSWMGRSTRAIADNQPEGAILYAVDTWRGTPSKTATDAECTLYNRELAGKPEAWLYQQFIQNLKDVNVIAFPLPSIYAAHYFYRSGEPFDMIFLDAAHDYDSVKADLMAWRPMLAAGGLLCGHDYHDYKGRFPGVDRAVDEQIPRVKTLGVGSLWYEVRKRGV